ncbi:MAG TPA: c-type cytochrome [Blastocatellia bacterium]|nr:c-type cytochrome [Blastocatellia bacterium]
MTKRDLKRGVGIVALAFAVCSLIASWSTTRVSAQQQQPPAAPAAPQTGPQEKLVDETRKNIQVLKGLPDSKLLPVMQLARSALGVQCGYCHVRQGQEWQFDKDDKQEKKTARKMMQMVLDINKTNFNGRTEVTCHTCHHGVTHPVDIASLPPKAEEPPARPATPPPAPTALPTPAQVIEKYIQAIGGKEAVDKLTSRVMKGSSIGPDGRAAPIEIYQKGDKLLTAVESPQQGPLSQALDGAGGWIKTRMELRDMNPTERARAKTLTAVYNALKVREAATRMRPGGRGKIGDREVIVLRMPLGADRSQQMSFDEQTGLLVRLVVSIATPIGRFPEQFDFDDYREVDGVKIPFTIQSSTVDARSGSTRKFTEIKHNVAIDDAKFNKPEK